MDTEIYPRDYTPFIIVNPKQYPQIHLLVLDRNQGSSVTISTCIAQLEELRDLITTRLAEIKGSKWAESNSKNYIKEGRGNE